MPRSCITMLTRDAEHAPRAPRGFNSKLFKFVQASSGHVASVPFARWRALKRKGIGSWLLGGIGDTALRTALVGVGSTGGRFTIGGLARDQV